MRKPELVIFDFDDTILHLDIDWSSVQAEVASIAAEGGVSTEDAHLVVMANDLSKKGLKERVDDIFLKHEMACVNSGSYRLFPKMASLIKDLDSQGIKLAIASGNHTKTISEILSRAGLLERFDVVCGRDKVMHNKPDPDQLLFILEALEIPKEKAIFAGDSLNDEGAAKAAGVRYLKIDPTEPGDGVKALRKLI